MRDVVVLRLWQVPCSGLIIIITIIITYKQIIKKLNKL